MQILICTSKQMFASVRVATSAIVTEVVPMPGNEEQEEGTIYYDTIFHQKLIGDSHGLTTWFVSMVPVSSEISIRCRMSWSWSV